MAEVFFQKIRGRPGDVADRSEAQRAEATPGDGTHTPEAIDRNLERFQQLPAGPVAGQHAHSR